MNEKPISKPLYTILAIAIPLLIASVGAFFGFRAVIRNMQSSLKNNNHVDIYSFANGFKDKEKFDEIMIDFYSMANMAEDIFPVDTVAIGREKALSNIRDIGIYYWDRNLDMIDSLDKLAHHKSIQPKIATYRTYSTLNKEYYTLLYKALDERSNKYDVEIEAYEAKINTLSKEIYIK
ncbi:hypothetical protein [Pedobacter sp.]|uniref:hypothetical protein n=1 Tax=Pedobacter sp. TaxID=1411316 RepID=UPI0031E28E26